MTTRSLVRNWWMMAIRGFLSIVFGVTVYVWPDVTLSTIVAIFGVYAIADGAWAILAGVWVSERVIDTWPIWLEGAVSVALGTIALVHPFVGRTIIWQLAAWGLLTGALELMLAAGVPRHRPAWLLLLTGAFSSLFLAVMLLILPHADAPFVGRILTAYAQVFGVALVLAASDFARQHRSLVAPAARS